MLRPRKYSVRFVDFKPSRNNYGWWMLTVLLFLCLIGFFYQIMVNRFGWSNFFGLDLPFFGGEKAYYLDILMVIINSIFEVLSVFNPILQIISDLTPISLQFSPIFITGDKWVIITRTLADAAIITLQISLSSIAIGFFIAIFLAIILVRPGRVWGLKPFSQAYVDFFRSTPLLVQLFIIFFGIPPVIQSFAIPGYERFTFSYIQAAIIGLSLNTAAYQAEIIRGGILAIPTGQTEAARALGLTSTQTMRHVILPQALRIIIPPFTNEGINIILNSSLASAISTWELTRAARNLSAFYFVPFEIYMAAALFYFVMAFSLAKLTKRFEKKFRIPGLGIHHD